MTKQLENILKKLADIQFDSNYLQDLEELVDELRQCKEAFLAMESILRFIEAHPDEDFGAPGPLVHWLEEFYKNGYEEQLLMSVNRKATPLNIWMLNRLINGSENKDKNKYIAIMKAIAKDDKAHSDARNLALRFLS